MTLLQLFRFLVPYFATAPDADVSAALGLAESRRPSCLTPAKGDEAVVWYAAWILFQRQQQVAAASAPAIPVGVISEKEGDLSRTYGFIDGAEDSQGFFGSYSALARQCMGGAITVGHRCGATPCCPGY